MSLAFRVTIYSTVTKTETIYENLGNMTLDNSQYEYKGEKGPESLTEDLLKKLIHNID